MLNWTKHLLIWINYHFLTVSKQSISNSCMRKQRGSEMRIAIRFVAFNFNWSLIKYLQLFLNTLLTVYRINLWLLRHVKVNRHELPPKQRTVKLGGGTINFVQKLFLSRENPFHTQQIFHLHAKYFNGFANKIVQVYFFGFI